MRVVADSLDGRNRIPAVDACVLHRVVRLTPKGERRMVDALDCTLAALLSGVHVDEITLKLVSRRLGCVEGALYRYFADRAELLNAVACRDHHFVVRELRSWGQSVPFASTTELVTAALVTRARFRLEGKGLASSALYMSQSWHSGMTELPTHPAVVVAREFEWGRAMTAEESTRLDCQLAALETLARGRLDPDEIRSAVRSVTVRRRSERKTGRMPVSPARGLAPRLRPEFSSPAEPPWARASA